MRYRICAMIAGVVTLAGCTKNGPPSSADSAHVGASSAAAATPVDANSARHAIDSTNAKFTDALARGDTRTLGATYASDAIAAFPGAPLFTGANQITKAFEQDFTEASIQNPKLHTDDVVTGADLTVENGTWSWTAVPKNGGKAEAQQGHYLTVWRHGTNGTWKILRDYVTADPAGK